MFRFSIRLKLALLSLFLFTIPWLGYEFVWEMEKYLRQGQENSLMGTVRAVATALHERPKLFDTHASFLESVSKGKDLYAYPIDRPIQLDGRSNDWTGYRNHLFTYDETYQIDNNPTGEIPSIWFNHMVGKYGNYLYALFEVHDDILIFRDRNSLSVDRNDHLKIALLTPEGEYQRFIIANTRSGWVNAYRLVDNPTSNRPARPAPEIQGHWQQTRQGYTIELRLPLSILNSKIAFAIADVDDTRERLPRAIIGTADTGDMTQLGTVLVPSPEIEQIIKGMGHSGSRIWVVDQHHRVLAKTGNIIEATGIWEPGEPREAKGFWQEFEQEYLHPLYYKVLTRPPAEFIDHLYDVAHLEGNEINSALAGTPETQWRLTPDNKAVILSAAWPIFIDNKVMGAVIAEETTHGIRTLRNRALEKLFTVILAVMTVGTLALFLFASRISNRIRRLRNQAEHIIDDNGRISNTIAADTTGDELGDLSRSFSGIVSRLTQYTDYLENMSSRLSHELRTPVTVVRSSLEHLSMQTLSDDARPYMERAQQGVNRLTTILSNMSEATRLEHTLQTNEKEIFDLNAVVSGCVAGYSLSWSDYQFKTDLPESPVMVNGAPEYIAQLLDKLVSNATDFSSPTDPIIISLTAQKQFAVLTIQNTGPMLPDEMKDRIFDSMVSVRDGKKTDQPHLGIGLYIARLVTEFHQGTIHAENLDDGSGVAFIIKIPVIAE